MNSVKGNTVNIQHCKLNDYSWKQMDFAVQCFPLIVHFLQVIILS